MTESHDLTTCNCLFITIGLQYNFILYKQQVTSLSETKRKKAYLKLHQWRCYICTKTQVRKILDKKIREDSVTILMDSASYVYKTCVLNQY